MPDELFTAEEFAHKLRIGRSTLFDWLRHGTLQPGRHFIKVGRVLRFIWSDDIVTSLAEATVRPHAGTKPVKRRSQSSTPSIDWEY